MNGKGGELFNKSRYGRVSTKRKFNGEEQGASLGESSRTVVRISPKKNKSKLSVSNDVLVNVQNGKLNEYSLGDIVLAKVGKYPVWPGIIINDPESNIFSKKENNIPFLHISYFNDGFKRNWIKVNQIFKFFGKKKIFHENPKIMTKLTRSKLKIKWNRAVDEAEYLVRMNKKERIQAYFDNNYLPIIKQELMNNSNKVNSRKSQNQSHKNKPVEIIRPSSQNITDVCATVSSYLENETVDSQNVNSQKTHSLNKSYPKDHPRTLIPELCKLFYSNGWVTGTGGGISIKYNNQLFIAPSGVQKERMEPEDLFVQDLNGADIELPPIEKNLSKSQCTPIFMCSYTERNAGAVIHIHSPSVVKLCLLNPENELRFSGLEMMKGIYNEEKARFYDNDEEIVIPIIENSKYEKDLVDTFKQALKKYPSTSAILVRNHGMYVWGKDWKSAKTQCECYEYVFNILVFKKTYNL